VTLRRWILLAILVAGLFAFYARQQIYVRDFRANVTRNAIHEDGAQVFFNVSDDVLLENDNSPMYTTLIQHDLPVRTPAQLNCIHYLVCFIAKDGATLIGSERGAWVKIMTSDKVEFRDDQGRDAVVNFH
jgi:hypothetical protein